MASAPLRSPSGKVLGAIAVVDIAPRDPGHPSLETFRSLTRDAALRIELDRAVRELDRIHAALERTAMTLESQAEILDLAGDTIIIADLEGHIRFWNQGAERLYGWSKAEASGRLVHDLLCTRFPESRVASFKKLLADRSWAGQLEHTRKDGSRVTVESRWTLRRGPDGAPDAWVEINHDVTDRLRAELLVRESEETFRDLIENAVDLIQSVGPDERILYVNRCWRETLGYRTEEAVGRPIYEFLRQDQHEHCRAVMQRVMTGQPVARVEVVFVAKDGRDVFCEGTSNCRIVDGRAVWTRGLFRDLTPARRAESARKQAETVLAQIVAGAGDGIICVDKNLHYTLYNPFMERLSGLPAPSVLGRRPDEVFPELETQGLLRLLERSVAGETVTHPEFRHRGPDGRVVVVQARSAPLRGADGQIEGAIVIIRDVTGVRELETELDEARERLRLAAATRETPVSLGKLEARSAAMRPVVEKIRQAAATDVTVLLTGESGTGKELAARALHELSSRRARPFVAINCSAIPEALLESELFGHVRGSFTGAVRDRLGLFQAADGGTLLLDEVGDISPAIQVKLLRVLQERAVRRVGDEREIAVDVRLVTATHRDLGALLRSGALREDFYYRLRVFEIRIPPLRDRPKDIPALVTRFVAELSKAMHLPAPSISAGALQQLSAYAWPGNVRELRNAIEHAMVTMKGEVLRLEDFPAEVHGTPGSGAGADEERRRIEEALRRCGGRKAEAAKLLKMSRVTLWKRMKEFGLGER